MRALTSRFQQKAMSLCEVPAGTACPCCHHDFDIVVSRKQLASGFMTRHVFRYFRCRVCGHLFARFNRHVWSRPARTALAILFCLCLGLSQVDADIIEYCDVTSDHVDFVDLTETSTGVGPMYGQPVDAGDAIVAPGTGFLNSAAGGSTSLVDGRLQMIIESSDGTLFNEISVAQFGSYFNVGAGALSIANALGMVESDGVVYTGNLLESFAGTGNGPWDGDFAISFPATDAVTFTLSSQLLASAPLGEAAYIDTSSIHIAVNAFVIPEPGMMQWLALAMLGLVAGNRRSRRRQRH